MDDALAILEVWQPHQFAGRAIYNLLLGESNPCGKLPTTFPRILKDSPAHQSRKSYPDFHYSYWDMIKHEVRYVKPEKSHKAEPIDIHYEEGIYVGYRHFDKHQIEPLFPFGFGLSYTHFEYQDVKLERTEIPKGEDISLSITITNIGDYGGAEVIQVYFQDLESKIDRPPKELVQFEKVYLEPGESNEVPLIINSNKLAYYDPNDHEWVLNPGEYKLLLGSSSRDIRNECSITIT